MDSVAINPDRKSKLRMTEAWQAAGYCTLAVLVVAALLSPIAYCLIQLGQAGPVSVPTYLAPASTAAQTDNLANIWSAGQQQCQAQHQVSTEVCTNLYMAAHVGDQALAWAFRLKAYQLQHDSVLAVSLVPPSQGEVRDNLLSFINYPNPGIIYYYITSTLMLDLM